MKAHAIVKLCERFHCLPSQLMEEDSEIFRMVHLADLVGGDDGGG